MCCVQDSIEIKFNCLLCESFDAMVALTGPTLLFSFVALALYAGFSIYLRLAYDLLLDDRLLGQLNRRVVLSRRSCNGLSLRSRGR